MTGSLGVLLRAGGMAAVFPLGAAAATLATGAVFDKVTGMKR